MATRTTSKGIPLGKATNHYLAEAKIADGSRVVMRAWTIAQSRGKAMVWLEDLQLAIATDGRDLEEMDRKELRTTIGTVGDQAKKDRARLARMRRNERIAAVEAEKEAKAAARKAKREAKKAATTTEEAAS